MCVAESLPEEAECQKELVNLANELEDPHRKTLRHLMVHFCRCCQHQDTSGHRDPPTKLSQVFCHILLRPPWENIM